MPPPDPVPTRVRPSVEASPRASPPDPDSLAPLGCRPPWPEVEEASLPSPDLDPRSPPLLEEIATDPCYHRFGAINFYTLTTRIGLKGLAHYKMIRGLINLLGVLRKEGARCGYQAKSLSDRIEIGIQLSTTIITD